MANRTIVVGNNGESDFIAFGDDSQFNDSLVFAFAIVRRQHLERALIRLGLLKKKFKFPVGTGIHCRELFSGQARQRVGLEHLTEFDVKGIIGRVVSIFNRVPMILRFAHCDMAEYRKFVEAKNGELSLTDSTGEKEMKIALSTDPKGVLGLLAQMCFAVHPSGKDGPPPERCEIFAARDDTKVKLWGDRKSKAHGNYAGFSDIGASAGTVHRIEPLIVDPKECPMLEYADVAAYLSSHASTDDPRQAFFREQLKRVRYWSRATYAPNKMLESDA